MTKLLLLLRIWILENQSCPNQGEGLSSAHAYPTAKAYYRSIYYEACDLLSGELERRFESQYLPEMLSIESTLMKAANGGDFQSDMKEFEKSCFGKDVNLSDLAKQLATASL